jgi:hypothetical protein
MVFLRHSAGGRLSREAGLSLVEVIVASGLLVGISLALGQVIFSTLNETKGLQEKLDLIQFESFATNSVQGKHCMENFKDLTLDLSKVKPNEIDTDTVVNLPVLKRSSTEILAELDKSPYGYNSQGKVDSIALTEFTGVRRRTATLPLLKSR